MTMCNALLFIFVLKIQLEFGNNLGVHAHVVKQAMIFPILGSEAHASACLNIPRGTAHWFGNIMFRENRPLLTVKAIEILDSGILGHSSVSVMRLENVRGRS